MARLLLLGFILVALVAGLLVASCGDDENPVEATIQTAVLTVQPAQLDFGSNVNELVLLLTTTEGISLAWTCSSSGNLVSYEPSKGSITIEVPVDTITVVVNRENLEIGVHTDTLKITSIAGTCIVPVSVTIGLEPLPTLLGEYEGIFAYTANYGLENEQPPIEYPILWRFSDQYYWCWDNSAEGENCFCEPSGEYIMADGVELEMIQTGCGDCDFDPTKLPDGIFSLRQPPDSVIMTQIVGDVRKDILLVPSGE